MFLIKNLLPLKWDILQHKKYSAGIFLITIIISIFVLNSFLMSNIFASEEVGLYEITTRPNLDIPHAVNGSGYNGNPLLNITTLYENCPEELAIVIHGFNTNESQAEERFDRVKMSLEHNKYFIPLIGLSWNSNTNWTEAKIMAKENGPKLAHFIISLMESCKNDPHNKILKIKLIGYSLGARVVLSTLENLHANQLWNNNNFKIESVHLLGAALDNEEVSTKIVDIVSDPNNMNDVVKKFAYGNAIQEEVNFFYNLYSTEDEIYQPKPASVTYPSLEKDRALGLTGYQKFSYNIPSSSLSLPTNYVEINVRDEIPPICDSDADGNSELPIQIGQIIKRGDNHGGYIGFRSTENKTILEDDGAINIIVNNWEKEEPLINEYDTDQTVKC